MKKKAMKRKMKHTNEQKNNKNEKTNKKQKTEKTKSKKCTFEEQWDAPIRKPNPIEKIKLLGIALEKIIIVSMTNHIYSYRGVKRIQRNCGPTGLDETGELGDVFLLWWDLMFIELVKTCNLSVNIYVRFKDDINILMERIISENNDLKNVLGQNYKSPREYNGSLEDYTANMMCHLANTVCDMIEFSYDTPCMNVDKKLPVLDVKVFINSEHKIVHEFYEKPTRNQRVILASSALSWAQKRSIHTQEILRRLKNTSKELDDEVRNAYVSKYLYRMKKCGYSQKFRIEVLKSAKHAYKLIIEKSKKENEPMYRNRKQLLESKKHKLCSPHNWWKTTKNATFTDILFVPPTPNGGLAKALRKREQELNENNTTRIRIIEKGGLKIKYML